MCGIRHKEKKSVTLVFVFNFTIKGTSSPNLLISQKYKHALCFMLHDK